MSKNNQKRLIADEKDGFSKDPHLILEALSLATLTASQLRILIYMLRRTNSWHQKEDAVSLKDFAYVCDSDRSYAGKQVRALVDKNILIQIGVQGQKHIYQLNPEISSWDPSCINIARLINIPKGGPYIDKKARKTIDSAELYKKNHAQPEEFSPADDIVYPAAKPTISKKKSPHSTKPVWYSDTTELWCPDTTPLWYSSTTVEPASPLEESEGETDVNIVLNIVLNIDKDKENIILKIYFEEGYYYQLAKLLADKINEQGNKCEEPDLQEWAMVIDYMINSDERHPEEIKEIIKYSQQDEFWRKMVPNTEKLRFFYDSLHTRRSMKNSSRFKGVRKEEKYEGFFTS